MAGEDNIQDELKNLNSGLPANADGLPFSVPRGYFDGLAASILAKVKTQNAVAEELAELSPLLATLPKAMPYSLPADYFDENLSALPFLFPATESQLNAAGKEMPYAIPPGYFEHLSQQVLAKVRRPERKLVPLFSRGWMRAAVAAVVGGIIFISGYQYFNRGGQGQSVVQRSADTSGSWMARNGQTVLQALKNVSSKDLDEFIEAVPMMLTEKGKGSSASAGKGEVEKLLKGVSKKEIENFLEQLPSIDEDLAIIN